MVTYFFVPDMTGVDLADEDEKFLKYLADNGWQGDVGDDEDDLVDDDAFSGSVDEKKV